MNIFWILSLGISSLSGIFIILFLIPCGNKITNILSSFISRFTLYISCFLGLYVLLLFQEVTNIRGSYNKKHLDTVNSLYWTAEYFKYQRNMFLILLGLVLLVGLLLISWQSKKWATKNEELKRTIQSM